MNELMQWPWPGLYINIIMGIWYTLVLTHATKQSKEVILRVKINCNNSPILLFPTKNLTHYGRMEHKYYRNIKKSD